MAYDPPSIVAVSIVLSLLAIAAVCLRFWTRLSIQPTHLGIDDWLVLGAVILLVETNCNLCVAAILGLQGRIYPGDPPADRTLVEKKIDYIQVIVEKPMYAMIKLSVLFFYRRIFNVHKRFHIYNNLMIALTIAWGIAFTFAEIFGCGTNPSSQWQSPDNPGTCINLTWLNFAFSISDTLGDILIVIMPYPCIRLLQADRRHKLMITFIFMLGTLSTIASIIRLYFVSAAFNRSFGDLGDPQGSGTPPFVWSFIEGAVGVIAACMPTFGPWIRRSPSPHSALSSLRKRIKGLSGRSSNMSLKDLQGGRKDEWRAQNRARNFEALEDDAPARNV